MDDRPRLADVFRALRNGKGPLWTTWNEFRLLLAEPSEEWLAEGVGLAIIATRRGYIRRTLIGRVGSDNDMLRADEDYFNPIKDKRVRAVILEEHRRC